MTHIIVLLVISIAAEGLLLGFSYAMCRGLRKLAGRIVRLCHIPTGEVADATISFSTSVAWTGRWRSYARESIISKSGE